MPKTRTSFRFKTTLAPIKAPFLKTAIYLPDEVIRQLPKGRVRVEGTFNGTPFSLAVQHLKDGSRYFSVSGPLRKAAGMELGDSVTVAFKLIDPDKLDIPEELEAILEQDEEARKAWDTLTRGYQRGLILYVTSVKNVDSRIRRALDLLNRAKAGLLHGQQRKRKNQA